MMMSTIGKCTCCGSVRIGFVPILWQSLINEWRLSSNEVDYVNRQQGVYCLDCGTTLRSMALALAIMRCFGCTTLFRDFVRQEQAQGLRVLEVNEAGTLTRYLAKIRQHVITSYPDTDLMNLPYEDCSFDLVVHSDTLEHVKHPIRALSECHRVLKPSAFCCFTVPIIVDRLTVSREGTPSYHGGPEKRNPALLVYTEYGCDAWKHVIKAGFDECRIYSLEYPSAQALAASRVD